MQQMAAGRLDLNTDVNTYLKDLQIPDTFPEPITLNNLMMQTPGFEDRPVIGLFARGPQTMGDFHSNLITMMPRRIMMPGRFAAYSNYGAALAAHLVEIVSNEDWDDYVDDHITKPLRMIDDNNATAGSARADRAGFEGLSAAERPLCHVRHSSS